MPFWIYIVGCVVYCGVLLLLGAFLSLTNISEEDQFELELYELLNRDR